jgi:hypothetical protein
MARAVCEADPRTLEQRRADALGALAHGGDRLGCLCDNPDCAAADAAPSSVVRNVIAEEKSLADDTAVALDGPEAPGPTTAQLREMTIAQALAQPTPTGPGGQTCSTYPGSRLLFPTLCRPTATVSARNRSRTCCERGRRLEEPAQPTEI